ncbi:hypothetical protein NPX13_g1207 [Xylaria arbuscula]|uniref:Uncharacterized protein n=1 Tax=Xylaria arbuscula TaxID=114810 RepID=A0A9W8NMY1_9PEZI|nr:hypothetical protein NPX13_g1207 [Xylaria arbuscula]
MTTNNGTPPLVGTGWSNTEYRSYEFADATGADPNASLRELSESVRRRKGSEKPYSEAEKMEMRAAYETILNSDIRYCKAKIAEVSANGETNGTNGA